MKNILERYIEKYQPTILEKHVAGLISNPCISLDFIEKHLMNYKYNIKDLQSNPNLTWEFVCKYNQLKWDYDKLCERLNLTWDIIAANPRKKWNYAILSGKRFITLDIILANPKKPWCFKTFSNLNKNVTWKLVKENPNIPWNFKDLSMNDNITIEDVLSSQDKPWDYYLLFSNKNITIDIINANPQLPWVFDENCKYLRGLTADHILYDERIELYEDYEGLSFNDTLTIKDIDTIYHSKKYEREKDWQELGFTEFAFDYIFGSKKITFNDIHTLCLPWNYDILVGNSHFTFKDVSKLIDQIDKKLVYDINIYSNPHVTFKYIKRAKEDKQDLFEILIYNRFSYNTKVYYKRLIKYIKRTKLIIKFFDKFIINYINLLQN